MTTLLVEIAAGLLGAFALGGLVFLTVAAWERAFGKVTWELKEDYR